MGKDLELNFVTKKKLIEMSHYSFRLIQDIDFECFKYNKKSISLAGGVCVCVCVV